VTLLVAHRYCSLRENTSWYVTGLRAYEYRPDAVCRHSNSSW
jgi:hypothetical protein